MLSASVIVVGGGPAGSSCAGRLVQHGVECLVLDRAPFPRPKLCAGWITPQVVRDLDLDLSAYPHGLVTFDALTLHYKGLSLRLGTIQHSIRRFEFDTWLLERTGAPVIAHTVRSIRREGSDYIIDDAFRCRWLVGAAGTRCPVYRTIFREQAPRDEDLQIVVLEEEFRFNWQDPRCHLWFFDNQLPGYSWYVPKGGGYLNVGIGALANMLHDRKQNIKEHWRHFVAKLEIYGLVKKRVFDPGGYTYYIHSSYAPGRLDNAFLVGDAAGLATIDLAEGIGPGIESGLRVANAILGKGTYAADSTTRRSLPGILRENRMLRWVSPLLTANRLRHT